MRVTRQNPSMNSVRRNVFNKSMAYEVGVFAKLVYFTDLSPLHFVCFQDSGEVTEAESFEFGVQCPSPGSEETFKIVRCHSLLLGGGSTEFAENLRRRFIWRV